MFDNEPGHFEIAVNQEKDVLSVLSQAFRANVGTHTQVAIGSITTYTTSAKFEKLSPSVRNCSLVNENTESLKIFR